MKTRINAFNVAEMDSVMMRDCVPSILRSSLTSDLGTDHVLSQWSLPSLFSDFLHSPIYTFTQNLTEWPCLKVFLDLSVRYDYFYSLLWFFILRIFFLPTHLVLVSLFVFVQFRLIKNTLCISGWPLIDNPPASASQGLQLKAYATTPSSSIFFIVWRTFLLFIKSLCKIQNYFSASGDPELVTDIQKGSPGAQPGTPSLDLTCVCIEAQSVRCPAGCRLSGSRCILQARNTCLLTADGNEASRSLY